VFRALLFLMLFSLSSITMALSYTVEITEAELQQQVTAMMPIEKKQLFFTVKFSNPEIDLLESSNKIGIFTHINLDSQLGIKGKGRAKIIGSLSYDSKTCAFYFKNSKIDTLEIDKVSQKDTEQIKGLVEVMGNKILAIHPIYKLKDSDLKQKMAKAVLQSVSVKNNKLFLTLNVL